MTQFHRCAGSLTSSNARHTASNCTKQLSKCQCFDFLLARLYCSKTWRPRIAPSAALLARASERVHGSTGVLFPRRWLRVACCALTSFDKLIRLQIAWCQAGSLEKTPRRAERRNIDTPSNWRPQTRRHPSNCNFGLRPTLCAKFTQSHAEFYDEFNAHLDVAIGSLLGKLHGVSGDTSKPRRNYGFSLVLLHQNWCPHGNAYLRRQHYFFVPLGTYGIPCS